MTGSERSWHFEPGDEIVHGRVVIQKLGGGYRYEAVLAWEERMHVPVVVKVLRPDQVQSRSALRGLVREGEMLRRLAHPVLLRGFDVVPAGPRPHLVLEHLEGPRLSTLLRKFGPLAPEQLLPLALELSSVLHYLAAEDTVHLDVKPSNIIMGGPPRLIDLSIARTTGEAAVLDHAVGTDEYLAPEQADPPTSGAPGPPADMWGLGATLYEALTGRKPFRAGTRDERAAPEARWPQLVDEPRPLPREVPDALAKPIMAALQRRAAARPTPAEFAQLLEPALAALPRPVLGGFKPGRR